MSIFRNMPDAVVTKLLQKIECSNHEAVHYDVFKSGVFACCVLQGKFCPLYTFKLPKGFKITWHKLSQL